MKKYLLLFMLIASIVAAASVSAKDYQSLDKAADVTFGTVDTGKLFLEAEISFEGATDDDFQTTLTVAEPTTPDKTVTIPDLTGTIMLNLVEDTTPQLGGDLDVNSKNIDFPSVANVSDVKDEDDMTSDSATMLATQQSIKAYADTKKPFHGIAASGALTFDNSTHVLTMASGANTYYLQGTPFTTAAAITCDIDSFETLTTNTLYYFYFDDATGTLKCADTVWSFTADVVVATVFWNGSAGAIQQETHNYTRDIDWHEWAHDTIGMRYESGSTLTYPDAANDDTLQIETGTYRDEDLQVITGQETTMRGWYQVSSGVYTFTDYAWPYLGTSGQPQFLDTDSYTLENVAGSDFVSYWVYASADTTRNIYIIPTQAATAYNTILLARADDVPEVLGLNINADMKLIYKFIYKGDGEFQESTDYRSSGSIPGGGTETVSAGSVSFAPAGDIASTNVQSAIEELDTEKIPRATVTVSSDFPDIDAAETVELDITGLPGDNVQSTLIRIYLSDGVNDPGADMNVNFRLEFFTKDTKLGQDRIGKPIYFNLTYTEVKTGTWSGAGTGGDLDSSAGLLVYDWIRLMGGTAESVNLVTITDADTVVVTTLTGDHVVGEGISSEYRRVTPFPFSDADGSGEIHAKLTALTDPGDAIGITVTITVK